MVKIETINMGAYNLHFIKTKKFKTITIDVDFYRKVNKKEITKRNLLKMILLDSSNDYKTERDLIIESENLYDIKVSSSISRIGNFSNLSFQTKFLNEKYTEKGMNKESIIFFLNLIFNPYVKDKSFVNIEKQKNKYYELKKGYISLDLFESQYVVPEGVTYNSYVIVDKKIAIMFISHDLSLIRQICDRVVVMQDGKIVEQGKCRDIFECPKEDYTKRLIEAIPRVEL